MRSRWPPLWVMIVKTLYPVVLGLMAYEALTDGRLLAGGLLTALCGVSVITAGLLWTLWRRARKEGNDEQP